MNGHFWMMAVVIAVGLVIAYFIDEWRWKRKSDDELIAMTKSPDPRRILIGLRRLQKRGRDLSGYLPNVLPYLTASRSIDRVAAKMILQQFYPGEFAVIQGYQGTDCLETCREKVQELYRRHGLVTENP